MQRLAQLLKRIDRKPYKAYKDIKGDYQFETFHLSINHVQGDPFAAPSRISLQLPLREAAFPENLHHNADRRIALEDAIGRKVAAAIRRHVKGRRGTGKSGLMDIHHNAQQVLRRNAVLIHQNSLEIRMLLALPAAGRTVLAKEAECMFFQELPQVVADSLFYSAYQQQALQQHVDSVEDQAGLRRGLKEQGLVAFIANQALLPRRSGIDQRPLQKQALRFQSPPLLQVELPLNNGGSVQGMGIPEGVTLIVGGGFHGKSTLLQALETGVYNHLPGDGREKVVTVDNAAKVRAEDGRRIAAVNISPFIDRLPFGKDTQRFYTENASGSTSQAANIMEALQAGSRLLLIDEDTSATNFMIRDQRMQALVAADKEPITPFLHRVRELYEQHGISSIIVMGGSGDYFEVADHVIMMDCYEPLEVTEKAHALAGEQRLPGGSHLPQIALQSSRKPASNTLNAARGKRDVKIDARSVQQLSYGEFDIDLSKLEQLMDRDQTAAIGWAIYQYAQSYQAQHPSMHAGLQQLVQDIHEQGLDLIGPYKQGGFAMPRMLELAAAINRMRDIAWE